MVTSSSTECLEFVVVPTTMTSSGRTRRRRLYPDAGLMGNDLADGLGLCRDVLNWHDALLRANGDSEEEDDRI